MGRRKRKPGPAERERAGCEQAEEQSATAGPGEADGEPRAESQGAAAAREPHKGRVWGRRRCRRLSAWAWNRRPPGPGESAARAAMAGYVPGQQPANRSQEKEFVQAYEDVLERYKGRAGGWPESQAGGRRGVAFGARALGGLQVGRPGGVAATAPGLALSGSVSGPVNLLSRDKLWEPSPRAAGAFISPVTVFAPLSGPSWKETDETRSWLRRPTAVGSRWGGGGVGRGRKPPVLLSVRSSPRTGSDLCPPARVPRPLLSASPRGDVRSTPGSGGRWAAVPVSVQFLVKRPLPPPRRSLGLIQARVYFFFSSKIKIGLGARISSP